jgi:hypothetical protein
MVKRGLVLDHSKSPCEESFIPNKKVKFVFTLMTAYISYLSLICLIIDRLCGLVVIVPGYRSRRLGSILGATRFSKKGLERSPLSLMSTIEELFGRKSSSSGLKF